MNNNRNVDLQRVSFELYSSFKKQADNVEYIKPYLKVMPPVYLGKDSVVIFCDPSIRNIFLIIFYRILGCKVIGGIHDVEGHDRKDKIKVFMYNTYLRYFCHGILLFSQFSKRRFQSLYGSVKNTYVYRYGMTSGLEGIDADALMENIDADVLYFGRVNEYSGKHNLKHIVRSCPDIKFLLMGFGMPDDVEHLENALVIPRRFSEEELKGALSSCSVVMFPYVSATQSGGIHLAAHSGANIVFYDVGGLAEQLSGYPSFSVAPGNLEDFRTALRKAKMSGKPENNSEWLKQLSAENRSELASLIKDISENSRAKINFN